MFLSPSDCHACTLEALQRSASSIVRIPLHGCLQALAQHFAASEHPAASAMLMRVAVRCRDEHDATAGDEHDTAHLARLARLLGQARAACEAAVLLCHAPASDPAAAGARKVAQACADLARLLVEQQPHGDEAQTLLAQTDAIAQRLYVVFLALKGKSSTQGESGHGRHR